MQRNSKQVRIRPILQTFWTNIAKNEIRSFFLSFNRKIRSFAFLRESSFHLFLPPPSAFLFSFISFQLPIPCDVDWKSGHIINNLNALLFGGRIKSGWKLKRRQTVRSSAAFFLKRPVKKEKDRWTDSQADRRWNGEKDMEEERG